jgi:ADP-ribose pyrophosphatase YjhB (NUDIX family)
MKSLYAKVGTALFVVFLPLIRIILRGTHRVGVALIYDGKIVLVKNWLARNTWRLPGGGMKKNERPTEAAAREIREELGLEIDADKLVLVTSGNLKADRLGYEYTVFAYLLSEKPLIRKARFEITEWGIFDSVPSDLQDGLEDIIQKLSDKRLL